MAAITPVLEKATGTVPGPMIICSGVGIVFTLKFGFEVCKLNSLWLFGITLGFGDFIDHT
jgi:hypothetical protein